MHTNDGRWHQFHLKLYMGTKLTLFTDTQTVVKELTARGASTVICDIHDYLSISLLMHVQIHRQSSVKTLLTLQVNYFSFQQIRDNQPQINKGTDREPSIHAYQIVLLLAIASQFGTFLNIEENSTLTTQVDKVNCLQNKSS